MENKVKVKIINKCPYGLPEYKTPGSSGCDLYAVIPHPIKLTPLERRVVNTGVFIQLPDGYEAQVRPRSGLTRYEGLVAAVSTIDSDYIGEISVILFNLSNEEIIVKPGERIAQLVICEVKQAEWDVVIALDPTLRGECGFGSTGRN